MYGDLRSKNIEPVCLGAFLVGSNKDLDSDRVKGLFIKKLNSFSGFRSWNPSFLLYSLGVVIR